MDRSIATVVLAQLLGALRHSNEVNSHSAPGYKSPRMFEKRRPCQALEICAKTKHRTVVENSGARLEELHTDGAYSDRCASNIYRKSSCASVL